MILAISPTFHIINFGCQMNARDTEWLSSMLKARGFKESPPEEAKIILLNTCSVREKPEKKVKNTIKRLEGICGPDHIIGILGCVAQQLGEKLYEISPRVRLVAGGDGIPRIPQALETLLDDNDCRMSFLQFSRQYPERELIAEKCPAGSAFVNIMQGCDNFCAYCIVPFTRGRQKSRQCGAVIAECSNWLAHGARDITLLGQNVNAYGLDKNEGEVSFPELLEKVAALPGLERLHFVTPHPKDMDQRAIDAFSQLPNLCPRLHLPLQAGSDRILERMGRRYSRSDFLRMTEKLRTARPDIALSTDLIVGFPGETEKDFEDTLELVNECAFMSSYSFCYSDRPGTRASAMTDKIAPEVMLERLTRLQALQDKLGQDWLAGRVGDQTTLLMECESPRQGNQSQISWQGRDPWGALVHVDMPTGDHRGKMLEVVISGAKRHSLIGRKLP